VTITNADDIAQTTASIQVESADGKTESIDGCTGFSYSNDMLAIGDPFSVSVPNVRGRWVGKLLKGQKIIFKLSNPAVNGGAPTLKHTGRIVERQAISDQGGTRVHLNCADLGWHLSNCDAELKYQLLSGTFQDLFDALLDPAWGIVGARDAAGKWAATIDTQNDANVQARLGKQVILNKSQLVASGAAGLLTPLYVLQTEPGDKIADLLTLYSRRFNLLLNVGVNGQITLWNPDYDRKPLYALRYHEDDRRRQNNILGIEYRDNLAGTYTEVTCVGEIVGLELAQITVDDYNSGRVFGTATNPGVLPYTHRKTFCDGEMFEQSMAVAQARWHYKREAFNAFSISVRVKGHHQNGTWWESDTMVTLEDSVNGYHGTFYIQAVKYERTSAGDVTDLTLRLPGLLSASYGVLKGALGAIFPKGLETMIR